MTDCEEPVILVADDDVMVRKYLRLVLESAGYRVLTACDGRQALGVARSCDTRIHLLVTDVEMPNGNGLELGAALTRERPGMKVLVVSGHSSSEALERTGWEFMRKPVSPKALLEAVAALLDPVACAHAGAASPRGVYQT